MIGPIDPGSFNFLGLAPPAPVEAGRGAVAQDAVTATVPVGGSADLVEVSREAQDASRAVNPAAPVKGGEEARPSPARGGQEAVERVVQEAQPRSSLEVAFSLNRELGIVQAQVVDRATGEIVRQIPPERRMRIAEQMARNVEDLFRSGENLDEEA